MTDTHIKSDRAWQLFDLFDILDLWAFPPHANLDTCATSPTPPLSRARASRDSLSHIVGIDATD